VVFGLVGLGVGAGEGLWVGLSVPFGPSGVGARERLGVGVGVIF
jgi:hypothetical protein